MGLIRKILPNEVDQMISLVVNAYPMIDLSVDENMQRFKERTLKTMSEDPISEFYGYFRDEEMLGSMKFYDYTMNWHGKEILAGGVGSVAVHLLHKKEKIAKELITYFLRHYKEKGSNVALLYSFRPDFYKKMGFGFGTKLHQYRIQPSFLPKGNSKEHIVFLSSEDREQLRDCYQRVMKTTHGMIERTDDELDSIFSNKKWRIVGYRDGERLEGYLVLESQNNHKQNRFFNDLHVMQMVAETPVAYQELFTFLHSQADQFQRIVFYVQDDEFYHLFDDPRNGTNTMIPPLAHEMHETGVGMMVRILNSQQVFTTPGFYPFGRENVTLTFQIQDTFLEENNQTFTVQFHKGNPQVVEYMKEAPEVRMDISHFSSLLFGSVSLHTLLKYGQVEISDPSYLKILTNLFPVVPKPICITTF